MKLNTRYAIYLAGVLLSGALLTLIMTGVLLLKDGNQFRLRLQNDLKYHLILDQQESLITTAEYLSRRLVKPLHERDMAALNHEIGEVGLLLPVRRFDIVDANGVVLTDGTLDGPWHGQRIEDGRIGHLDLAAPHIYSFPGVDGVAGGIGLAFAVRQDEQVIGYARIILEENYLVSSAERVTSLLATMWRAALDMLYTLGLFAVLGAVLIAISFSGLFSRWLSTPLVEMSRAARKFASGQLDYVIPLNSRDEIGELAGSLNTMAHQIWKSGRLLSKAQEMSGVGGWEFDRRLERFDWSPQVGRIFGVRQDMLPSGLPLLAAIVHPEDRSALQDILDADYSLNPNFSIELRLVRPGRELRTLQVMGEVTLGEDQQPQSMIGTFQDISDRKLAEEGLRFLANFDPLTGLPNRSLFHDRLTHALGHADRNRAQVGLLFIDLDHFKMSNDRQGHAFGDALLKQVAERLSGAVREVDTVARMGGDEFTIILENLSSGEVAAVVADKVLQTLRQTFCIGGHELHVTASIGIAMYPSDARQADTLLSNADTAMYRAKDEGRDGYRFFTREMEERIQARLVLETALRTAMQKDEFVLFYQPQVEIDTGDIVGFEALLRWRREDGTLVSPVEFVPVLEETGLIVEVGAWVIGEACRWLAKWRSVHGLETTVAVNISPRQFSEVDLPEMVAQTLQATALPASALELEITESSLVNAPATLVTMNALRQMGVGLAIDDFGTGYSSLSYLKRFPITKLKIDQSFVRHITEDRDGAAIVSAIIALGHILQLEVVAEGVEKIEELGYLREQGCNQIQGYLISRPLDEKMLADWYANLASSMVGHILVTPFAWRGEEKASILRKRLFDAAPRHVTGSGETNP